MKKLQRFGIASVAALTLTAFALSNEQIVKAEETTSTEISVPNLEPVEEFDSSRADEAVESPTDFPVGSAIDEKAGSLGEVATSSPVNFLDYRRVTVRTDHYFLTPTGLHLIKTGTDVLFSDQPERKSIAPEPLPFVDLDLVGARIHEGSRTYDYLGNDPTDNNVKESFKIGSVLSLENGLSSDKTVTFYYKSKGLELIGDYATLPAREDRNRIGVTIRFMDEDDRDLDSSLAFKGNYDLIPGVEFEIESPEIPGYRAKQKSLRVSYEDLKKRNNESDYIRRGDLRFYYEKISADVVVKHVQLGDSENDYKILDEEKFTVKSGEPLTVQSKDLVGYKPVTKSLILDYATLSKGHIYGRTYEIYYTKDGQLPEWIKKKADEPRRDKIRVVHVFDDGSSEPHKEIEELTLTPNGAVVIPVFKELAGWQPDRSRSRQGTGDMPRLPHFTAWAVGDKLFEEHIAYRYESLTNPYYFELYYNKVATEVDGAEVPNTEVDTKPTQPTDTDTPTPTDNTAGNIDAVDSGSQGEGSANGSKTTPVTPQADNNGENQTNPTETPSTDTTVDNGGTSDTGEGSNTTDTTAPTTSEDPVDNTGNVGKEDGKTAEVSSPSDSSVNHTGTSDTGEETNHEDSNTSVNSDTLLSPVTSDDVTDNTNETEVVFPIVVLDDKTDTSTSSEAVKTLANQKGERHDSLVKKQTLSRVESRHLPKTNDGHNVLSALGLAILMTLGLYRPNKRKA